MPDTTPAVLRPVPTWVRVWAILTFTVALLLLFVLGGFVTSFRVGMADRVWPTEPWYLVVNNQVWSEEEPGFLIEHTHRAAGWIVGLMVIVLAAGAWYSEPNKKLRWFGLIAIVSLVAAYGEFHRGMRVAYDARESQVPWEQISLPVGAGVATAVAATLCLVACVAALAGGRFGRWARSLCMLTLIGVMIQGLLGGFRVFLDQLFGTTLAAYHGVFGQIVLVLMAACMVLGAPRRPGDGLPAEDRARLGRLALLLPALIFVQLVWAVWLRHMGSPVAQRLHLLTAFLVTGVAVWLSVRALATPTGRRQIGFLVYHLLAIVAVQVMLGVEAYLAKFAAAGPQATTLPMERIPRPADAGIRTAHAVIGAALLVAAVVLALRVLRRPVAADESSGAESRAATMNAVEPVASS